MDTVPLIPLVLSCIRVLFPVPLCLPHHQVHRIKVYTNTDARL